MPSQPPIVVFKMEAQLKHIHIAYTFCTNLYAQSVLINKISAWELRRKFIKSLLWIPTAWPKLRFLLYHWSPLAHHAHRRPDQTGRRVRGEGEGSNLPPPDGDLPKRKE